MVGRLSNGNEREGLLVEGLTVKRGNDVVIKGFTLSVKRGEAVGITGHSGVGKTTLMLALMGVIPATDGRVLYNGKELKRPADRLRVGIGFAREGRGLFCNMTVRENINVGAYRCPTNAGAVERAVRLFPEIKPLLNRTAGLLSGGEQQMVAISRALACDPELLVLDEATMGLSPSMTERVFKALSDIHAGGTGILIAGQETDRIAALCKRTQPLTRALN